MVLRTLHLGVSSKNIATEIDPIEIETKKSFPSINDSIITNNASANVCVTCKGRNMACGKTFCPIITQFSHFLPIKAQIEKKVVFGSSPPSVFIGRAGYPKVFAGPLVPPITGDTSYMDLSEQWFAKDLESILDMRMQLIRGKSKISVHSPGLNRSNSSNKYLELLQEINLADRSVEMEVQFKKPPQKKFSLDADVQPMGPSALVRKARITSNSTDHRVQKISSDTDLKANLAIIELKKRNVEQSKITQVFSVGLLGVKRKLVPTRWSITAVDSSLGIYYWKKLIYYPILQEFRVFESNYLNNRFLVVLIPDVWGYELMEAFFPGSVWNMGEKIAIGNDYEGLKGRKTYAAIGGCYYSARNMVGEYLYKIRRQARAIVFRECYPGFIMPLGVWFVRENVRHALSSPYLSFDSLQELMSYIKTRLTIPLKYWYQTSGILSSKKEIRQRSLYHFIKQ